MVSLAQVRAHNATLKSLPQGLVAVFVGGTSGIGFSTAREFVRNTTAPHVYLVGRNDAEATRIISELQQINPSSKLDFIKSDVSLLHNVDEACRQIKEKEQRVNLLFMTVGYITMQGRQETSEGLDRKFALHYYSRMRFVQNLLPLLANAADSQDKNANLSRVVSVFDPKLGRGGVLNTADLSLKTTFSLRNCAVHASAMQNFALEHFAKAQPGTSFIHAYPSGVNTGVLRGLGSTTERMIKASAFLLRPFMVDFVESGERHLYAATAPQYVPSAKASGADNVAKGADGVIGSGSYVLNWNGDSLPDSATAEKMRAQGMEKTVWEHTEDVYRKICEEGAKY